METACRYGGATTIRLTATCWQIPDLIGQEAIISHQIQPDGAFSLCLTLLLSLQAFLVGIVVPDAEAMPGWAKKRGFDGTYEELCRNKVGCCTFLHCSHCADGA